MRKFLYPVDIDQFAQIRESGKVYVDKTDMVHDLVTRYNYVFLARPRRFGKSLLCNTFDAYFNGRKELFEGLKIMDLETEWKKYPVLHFTMSGLKNLPVDDAKSVLSNMISRFESVYGRNPEYITPGDRFRDLIHRVHEQTGERVVVILDEYDAAIMRLLHEPELRDKMRTMLREFYQVLKDEGAHLRFTFITGVTKFSQLSIFSELNNLLNISMMPEYSGLCGITKDELEGVLRPCVEDFAEGYGCSVDEAYSLLKRQYDGYHFCKSGQDIFSPYSLLRALSARDIGDYWYESSTSQGLIDHLKYYPGFNALEFDGMELRENQFNIPIEDAQTPVPLLYQSGYLTIDRYDSDMRTYWLHFPNEEVRVGMVEGLAHTVVHSDEMDENALVIAMVRAFKKGNLSTALMNLRAYIGGIPYDIITKEEWDRKKKRESFYKLLMYIVFSMVNSMVDCEHKSIRGRSDVVIQTKDDIFVIELKVDGTVEEALSQIDDTDYAVPWSSDGRRVTKCGAVIDSGNRNITHWKMTDETGKVIEEKDFSTGDTTTNSVFSENIKKNNSVILDIQN